VLAGKQRRISTPLPRGAAAPGKFCPPAETPSTMNEVSLGLWASQQTGGQVANAM